MQAIIHFLQSLLSLLGATLLALWKVIEQGGAFFRFTFGGDAGKWLLGALIVLGMAIAFNFCQRRAPLPHPDQQRARGLGYCGTLGMLLLALGLLLYARLATGLPEPGQRPIFYGLTIVIGLHLAWFGGDLISSATRWGRGERFFKQVLRNRTAYYMILPSFILIGTFLYVPAVSIFYYSFFQYDLGGTKELIGLGNYVRMFHDEVLWKSAGNMAILTTLSVFFTLTVSLMVAELIFHLRTERMRYFMRAAFLIPMVIPGVIVFLIWGAFYSDSGLIPLLGHAVGLGDRMEGLLSRPQTALLAVVFVGFPFVMGINLLIFYAGLSNIDETVWEAAELDGAKPFRRFFMIDLPLLARQFKLVLILGIIAGIQAFENVLVMTQGGPGWQTMLPGLYMYRSATSFNEYGFACAIGVILFLLVLALAVAVNRGFPNSKT